MAKLTEPFTQAEVEVPEQDEETKAVFAQDPNDIKR